MSFQSTVLLAIRFIVFLESRSALARVEHEERAVQKNPPAQQDPDIPEPEWISRGEGEHVIKSGFTGCDGIFGEAHASRTASPRASVGHAELPLDDAVFLGGSGQLNAKSVALFGGIEFKRYFAPFLDLPSKEDAEGGRFTLCRR